MTAGSSAYITYQAVNKPPGEPVISPVISKPIERPKTITREEAFGHLWHYDNDPVIINWKINKETNQALDVTIKGNLYQREFTQNVQLPITEKGNWKLYAGIGLGALATAGAIYGGYKLVQAFK